MSSSRTTPVDRRINRIEPPALTPDVFEATMNGLETGLRVGDIATSGFASCDADDDVHEVMRRPELLRFDCVPVIETGHVVGVLERNGDTQQGAVRERMRRLDDGLLVSSDELLKAFIPLLIECPHRLVVHGTRITGIVTSSDVHKLPVRLLAFALITHLEMTMAQVILRGSEGDDWILLLKDGRRKAVEDKFRALQTASFDPPLIEVTDFCDKRDVLDKRGILVFPSRKKAVAGFKKVENLRNSLAHAASYAQDQASLAEFVALLELTEEWITRLSQLDLHTTEEIEPK
jgi:predicted transcriptional regulator